MRYMDLCTSAKMVARVKIIEQTKEFKEFKKSSEEIINSRISSDTKSELWFSVGATLLELTLLDTDSKLIVMVQNGKLEVQWFGYFRITTNARKAKIIENNLLNLIRKDLFRIDEERDIMFGYVPVSELEKYNFDSLGYII